LKKITLKIILAARPALLLIALLSIGARAQDAEKKETEKTTIDAWRQSVSEGDQSASMPPTVAMKESKDNVEGEETPAQTEKRILDLERRLLEALKLRDSSTLRRFFADDFILAGMNPAGNAAQTDKIRYIEWALKNPELKSYSLEKPMVRVYPSTAIVTFNYKRQATINGSPADGDFIVTDVWVRRGKQWRAASRHISPLPKP
jgi:ketosteroid isomerase-like protein